MLRRNWPAVLVVGLGIFFLGCYGISQAAGRTPGGGPGEALSVPDGWQTVAPGQQIWYAFDYGGDKSQILVQLSAQPAAGANFAIWSPTDVDRWIHGGSAVPTGRGSPNAYRGGDMFWAGSSSQPGMWYVVVEAAGSSPSSFNLKVDGSRVSPHLAATSTPSPGAARLLASTPLPAAGLPASTPVPVPLVRQVAPGAAGRYGLAYLSTLTPTPARVAQYPADALPLPDGPQTLGVGEHVWYAFEYPGDRSRITMQLHADPPGSANFTVWSWDVLQRWHEGYFYTPTGRGTPNNVYGGDLTWLGGSIIKGKWYVIVEQNGASPSTYTLQVNGTGVDRTLPTATPTPTPTYSILGSVLSGH